MSALRKSVAKVILVVVSTVAVATVVRGLFFFGLNESVPYTPFYPAIVVATMYGRLKGGILALVLSIVGVSISFAPFGKPFVAEPTDVIGVLLFTAVSATMIALCEAMRRSQQRAEEATCAQQRLLRLEQSARRAAEEANALKDTFLASVSHELRTPLQAIIGWTELLRGSDNDQDTMARGLEVIGRNAKIQSSLIEDLLDMGRITSGKMRLTVSLVNPRQVIESAIQTVAMAAQAKSIRIIRQFDDSAFSISADPNRLQQIVWNLLANAIKFSPQGSQIEVALSRDHEASQIRVIDHGKGISRDLLPHMFEPFRQGDSEKGKRQAGLGLGLTIVKHLTELHGGTITAESEGEGRGVTMTVRLPHAISAPAGAGAQSKSGKRLQGVRVLVVDDDPEICELVSRLLEEQHAQVLTATRSSDALDAVKAHPIDVIVSDIAMPEPDGYELLRQIRRQPKLRLIPAMALTAHGSEADHLHAFEAGYALHLTKPVESKRLTEAVAELAATSR